MTDLEKREAKIAFVEAVNLAIITCHDVYDESAAGKYADVDWRRTIADTHAQHAHDHLVGYLQDHSSPEARKEHARNALTRCVMLLWKETDDDKYARKESEQTDA